MKHRRLATYVFETPSSRVEILQFPQVVPEPAGLDEAVIFLTQDLCRGGAERVFTHLVNHLEKPHPIPVIVQSLTTMAGELTREHELRTLATHDGQISQRAEPGQRSWLDRFDSLLGAQLVSFPIKALRLGRMVRSRRITAISSFLPKAHVIAALARLLFARDLRLVMNVHCLMSQHIAHHFPAVVRPAARWVLRVTLHHADAVFAVAAGVRQDLLDTFELDPDKVHVVWNPLDLSQIRSLAQERLDDGAAWSRPTIVGIGRLTRLKGYHDLLEALAIVRQRVDAHVVLVGEGPERAALSAQAQRLGIAEAVHLVGEQPNPWRFLARADVLAHPSFTEAFPNVLGEAMALDVPVIASECSPGVTEYLEGGAAGVLVQPGDVQGLADAVAKVLSDATLRIRLLERGAARVESFELRRAVDEYRERLMMSIRPCPQSTSPAS